MENKRNELLAHCLTARLPYSLRCHLECTDAIPQGEGWTTAEEAGHVFSVAFSPSGSRLVVAGPSDFVKILNVSDGKELVRHDQHLGEHFRFANAALFSNDDKAITSAGGKRAVELWEAASGETVRWYEVPEKQPPVNEDQVSIPVAFSSDGTLLAVESKYTGQEELVLFDMTSGKPRLTLPLGKREGLIMSLTLGRAAFAPEGDVLATAYFSNKIIIWDLKDGKKVREFVGHEGAVSAIAISPNGRTLASCSGDWGLKISRRVDSEDHTVRLWEMATGRLLLTIKGHSDNVLSVVFSPDGRSFLSGGEDKTIRLWETLSGKELYRWNFDDMVGSVAVSPDGKKVAAALFNGSVNAVHSKGSVTLFPIDSPRPDKHLSAVDDKAFQHLWADLAGEDAEQAYRAVRTLSEGSEDVPSLIGKRLRRATSLSRWIADLDSDDFDRREAATKELAALGAQVQPALRKALQETTSEEVRSRIAKLLKPLGEWAVTDPDTLRSLRAIWVLERIGTPEARSVLEDLAKGAPEVRQTQEARAALDFLDKRAAAAKP